MYIRAVKTRSKGKEYTVHRLVESYKTQEGKVKQRVIMNLGTISVPKNRWKELATLLEQRIQGCITLESYTSELDKTADELYARNVYAKAKPQAIEESLGNRELVKVDINSIQTSESRSLGAELVADQAWKDLEFEKVFEQLEMSENEKSVAKALIIGRLVSPGSELSTRSWFQNNSALSELTNTDISKIGKDLFYTTADVLYKHKNALELHLYNKETDLFSLGRRCYLFDLTNTYLEGSGKMNDLAGYGKSKEKRTDCPLVAMALMVDEKGFPVYSRIYEGNTSEPKTLKEVIEDIKNRSECFLELKMPTFIMDRGIATADNIKYLQEEGYKYILIERGERASQYEEEYKILKSILDQAESEEATEITLKEAGWGRVSTKNDVYIKKQELDGLCQVLALSLGRESKELAMDAQKEKRFLEDVSILKHRVTSKKLVMAEKVSERIGRLREKYSGMASNYELNISFDPENKKRCVDIEVKALEKIKSRPVLAGTYVILTNQFELSAEDIWQTYMTQTRVESAFRDLKSELGFRPIYHHKADRTSAHLFISMLAYHLLVTIETKLRAAGDRREWATIRKVLSTYQRTTVTLVGENNEIYTVRVSGKPEDSHKKIFDAMGVSNRLKNIKSVIGPVDSRS